MSKYILIVLLIAGNSAFAAETVSEIQNRCYQAVIKKTSDATKKASPSKLDAWRAKVAAQLRAANSSAPKAINAK